MNKKIKLIEARRECVKYILRGTQRRRAKALETARELNSEGGIRAKLFAVK